MCSEPLNSIAETETHQGITLEKLIPDCTTLVWQKKNYTDTHTMEKILDKTLDKFKKWTPKSQPTQTQTEFPMF